MPTGNWVSNKANATPLNLSDRSAKGTPRSVNKEHDNSSTNAGFQAIAPQPVSGGLAPGRGERVDNQPRGMAGCVNHRGEGRYKTNTTTKMRAACNPAMSAH